jgi:hypothetical protein
MHRRKRKNGQPSLIDAFPQPPRVLTCVSPPLPRDSATLELRVTPSPPARAASSHRRRGAPSRSPTPHQAAVEVLRAACQCRVEVRCVEVASEVCAPLHAPRRGHPLALSSATSPAASPAPELASSCDVMWYANAIRCCCWRRPLYHRYVYAVQMRHIKFCTSKMLYLVEVSLTEQAARTNKGDLE